MNKALPWTPLPKTPPIGIQIGTYSFSSTLIEADSRTLNANKIAAKWTEATEVCKNAECLETKPLIHTTFSLGNSSNNVTFKLVGKNLSGGSDDYGWRLFADLCDTAGDGATFHETATLTVDGIEFNTEMTGTCKVKNKTATKNGESFDLTTTTVKASD